MKDKISEHENKLHNQISKNAKKLIEVVNKWEEPLVNIRDKLIMQNPTEMDNSVVVGELQTSITDGLKGGIEELVLTASLESDLPSGHLTMSECDCLYTDITFVPDDSISVKQVRVVSPSHEATSTPRHEATPRRPSSGIRRTPLSVGRGTPPSQQRSVDFTRMPIRKWHKGGLQWAVDVVFPPIGHIVVCEPSARIVLMCNSKGKVVTSSKDRGVEYEDQPCRIASDPHESAVIVTQWKEYLTVLSDEDLTMRRKLTLQVLGKAAGIAVLSDGRLVVGDYGSPETIRIYDRQGRRQRSITHYGHNNQHKVWRPDYITVLPGDIIVVVMWTNNHVVYLSPELQCLQVVEDARYPWGLTVTPQGDILVAGLGLHRVYHLKGTVGSIQSDVIMEFSDEDKEEYGSVQSVAMKDNQLAVVFSKALHLYEWR